eukprot:scaffold45859_cov58-Phaeocystis_antarctica.AAC.2
MDALLAGALIAARAAHVLRPVEHARGAVEQPRHALAPLGEHVVAGDAGTAEVVAAAHALPAREEDRLVELQYVERRGDVRVGRHVIVQPRAGVEQQSRQLRVRQHGLHRRGSVRGGWGGCRAALPRPGAHYRWQPRPACSRGLRGVERAEDAAQGLLRRLALDCSAAPEALAAGHVEPEAARRRGRRRRHWRRGRARGRRGGSEGLDAP